MHNLSLQDQIQQYGNSLILYKGKPHKVKSITGEVKLLDLKTQRTKLVAFDLEKFQPVVLRLGYVNSENNAVFVARKPMRQFCTGIKSDNCSIGGNRGMSTQFDMRTSELRVKQFDTPEVYDMLMGHYPSLKSAAKEAHDLMCSIAFDKQFAIDAAWNIFYKDTKVGSYDGVKIIFNKSHEYLSILLDGKYEKATRAFG